METQGLDTISQPQYSCSPVPPHLLWLLPSCLLLFFLLSPLFPPSHFSLASPPLRSLSLPLPLSPVSLPADVPCCPPNPTQNHPCIPQGTRARVPKIDERHTETDQLAARQPQRRETFRQRKVSLPLIPSKMRKTCPPPHPHSCQGGGRKKWEISLPSTPRTSEPSMLNFFFIKMYFYLIKSTNQK